MVTPNMGSQNRRDCLYTKNRSKLAGFQMVKGLSENNGGHVTRAFGILTEKLGLGLVYTEG